MNFVRLTWDLNRTPVWVNLRTVATMAVTEKGGTAFTFAGEQGTLTVEETPQEIFILAGGRVKR